MKQPKSSKRKSALERRKVNLEYWKSQVKSPDPKLGMDSDAVLKKVRICEHDIEHLEKKIK